MRNLFYNFSYKFQMWMQGRYGIDELFKALTITSLALFLLSSFSIFRILYLFALLLLAWSYFRFFSRNIEARRKELYKYFNLKNKLTAKYALKKRIWNERKTHRFYKCKKCGKMLRVPKGKGKIKITCSSCQNVMIKKT